MQTFKPTITDKYYFKYVIITFLTIFCVISTITYFVQPLDGDLTRVGSLKESEYGPLMEQPVISIKSNAVDAGFVDTVVLGDSFSKGNIWQSVYTKISGRNTKTFAWDNLSKYSCLQDWVKKIRLQYPRADKLIIQTVEREYFDRFSIMMEDCPNIRFVQVPVSTVETAAKRPNGLLDSLKFPLYSIKAMVNELEFIDGISESGQVKILKLNRENLFSNRLSNNILVYKDDFNSDSWSEIGLARARRNVIAIHSVAKIHGLSMYLLIIPDKTTVYSKFINPTPIRFSANIHEAVRGEFDFSISVVDYFISAASSKKDIYKPNDSHLSAEGYLILARLVHDATNK